ncbi:MAG TPA: hypothetical protein VFD36_08715 [Kofleriaceae bacterium]|jgi:hypothetical protein|nr:hypothetical protein [Kofleriaceae bacterium]
MAHLRYAVRDDGAVGMTLLQYGPMQRAIWVPCCIGLGVCVGLAGCSKKSQDGLPPATEWQASIETAPPAPGTASDAPRLKAPGMGRKANPHAGMDMGDPNNPHAGLDMSDPSNPHAGLDMSDPSNPHAGVDMGGTDVTKLGLSAPDPDRAIDPSRRVAGKIVVDPKARDKTKPGTSVFLIVKRAGPDGAPTGSPLAVDKLTWSDGGVAFELTEAQAMVAGTELSGDVVVTARYDQDSDALSRQPGDITGQVRVTIPADNVKLTLDTVLP